MDMTPSQRAVAARWPEGDLTITYTVTLVIEIDADENLDEQFPPFLTVLMWPMSGEYVRAPGPRPGTDTLTITGSSQANHHESSLEQVLDRIGMQEVGELVSLTITRDAEAWEKREGAE